MYLIYIEQCPCHKHRNKHERLLQGIEHWRKGPQDWVVVEKVCHDIDLLVVLHILSKDNPLIDDTISLFLISALNLVLLSARLVNTS